MRHIGGVLAVAAVTAAVMAASAATPVRAEVEAAETREGQQRELGLGSGTRISLGGLGWAAFAQLAGEGTADLATRERRGEGAAAVGAELRVGSPRCDVVRIGGQARLAWAGSARPSAEQWASGCLVFDIATVELGHHLEWDVRPSLLAPVQLRAGLNRRETVRLQVEPFRLSLAAMTPPELREGVPAGSLVLFALDTHLTVLWSEDTPLVWRQQVEATGIRYESPQLAPWGERRDFGVDIVAGGGEFTDEGSSMHAWVVRIENVALGPVYASGGIGVASAAVGPFIDPITRQVELTTPRVLASLETGGDLVHGSLRVRNDVGLTADGFAVVDSRVSGGLALEASSTRFALDGFAGTAELHAPDRAPVRGATGGASLAIARGVGAHLEATLQLEAARSFYALPPDEMTGALGPPRWGVSAMAALQATAGRRPAARGAAAPAAPP
ncbi:MAG TPA: hypothetical protein VK932_08015 [Kofleriaceae bacterium]|nr:hypothetical protein [Kofleriaceae bacterium]